MDGIAEDDDFYDDCAGSSFQAWSVILTLEDIVGIELEFSAFLLGSHTAGRCRSSARPLARGCLDSDRSQPGRECGTAAECPSAV